MSDSAARGTRRDATGRAFSMSRHQWTFPPEAAYLSLLVVSFSPGDVDDHWLIELQPPPAGYALPVEPQD